MVQSRNKVVRQETRPGTEEWSEYLRYAETHTFCCETFYFGDTLRPREIVWEIVRAPDPLVANLRSYAVVNSLNRADLWVLT